MLRPSSFGSGMNGILHPTALPWWGRQHEPMPLRWSLADAVASVAINMPLQKELFASSRKGRSISPLSPFPPVQSQTHEPTLRVPISVSGPSRFLTGGHAAREFATDIPNQDFVGADLFSYVVRDSRGATNTVYAALTTGGRAKSDFISVAVRPRAYDLRD